MGVSFDDNLNADGLNGNYPLDVEEANAVAQPQAFIATARGGRLKPGQSEGDAYARRSDAGMPVSPEADLATSPEAAADAIPDARAQVLRDSARFRRF